VLKNESLIGTGATTSELVVLDAESVFSTEVSPHQLDVGSALKSPRQAASDSPKLNIVEEYKSAPTSPQISNAVATTKTMEQDAHNSPQLENGESALRSPARADSPQFDYGESAPRSPQLGDSESQLDNGDPTPKSPQRAEPIPEEGESEAKKFMDDSGHFFHPFLLR
jgi:hypothetical protein